MKAHSNGIAALAAGDFNIRSSGKEVFGILEGREVILFWNVKGDNPQWAKDAVKEYQKRNQQR